MRVFAFGDKLQKVTLSQLHEATKNIYQVIQCNQTEPSTPVTIAMTSAPAAASTSGDIWATADTSRIAPP